MDSLYNTIYIGNKPGSEQIYTHAETLDNKDMVIESAVLAGPVTFVTPCGILFLMSSMLKRLKPNRKEAVSHLFSETAKS